MTFQLLQDLTDNIKANNTVEERKAFYKYSKDLRNTSILDIGTAFGGSAFVFALASHPSVNVFTIDPNKNENFFIWRERLRLQFKLTYFEDKSENVAKNWLPETKLSLVFVDGVHSYEGVKSDFENFYHLIKKGGIVMFHDYYMYDGIKDAVDEIVKSGKLKKLEIIDSLYQNEARTGLFIGQI